MTSKYFFPKSQISHFLELTKHIFIGFPLGFPTQVNFTCAQFENSCVQFREIARNGIAIGNTFSSGSNTKVEIKH